MALLIVLLSTSGYAAADSQSGSATTASGSCNYVGPIPIALPNGTAATAKHYICSDAPIVTTTPSGGVHALTASGNNNYLMYWTSGSCSSVYCTDTDVGISTTMAPNTAYWSVQDNAVATVCGSSYMTYQDVMVVGTYTNGYNNQFGVQWLNQSPCGTPVGSATTYYILTGTNLNVAKINFNTYYTLSSGGHPTAANDEIVDLNNGNYWVYTYPMPSGSPTYAINGWEENLVCSSSSCTTNFTAGSGYLVYYQSNIADTGPYAYTGEKSNCAYSSITLYSGYADQTFSC